MITNITTLFNLISFSTPIGAITLGEIFQFIFILSLTILISKIITFYMRRSLKDKVSKDVGETIIKLFYYGTIIIVSISVLERMGLQLSGLLLAGGITGIILGFASQNIVGNLISGIFLIIEKPIKIGDQVEIDKISGFVTDIRIISTLLRTHDGLLVRIPNQRVFTSNITNLVGFPVRRFDLTVGIRYRDDADNAISVIKDLIDKEPFALLNPKPAVYVNELGDSSVNIIIRIWAPVSEWFDLKSNFILTIKKTLDEKGIEIPFPQHVVYLHNVPEKNLILEHLKSNQEKEIESVLNYEERVFS